MPVIPATPWTANSTNPYADQSYQDGLRPSGNVPELTSPDFTLTENFESTQPASFYKEAFATWGDTDPTDGSNKVLSADYSTEGLQPDNSAFSEMEVEISIQAVQVIVKFREYTPASYTAVNTSNHKSIGLWSGTADPISIVGSNIAVTAECWPATGGASPRVQAGGDGDNWGQLGTTGDPLIWINADTQWHDFCAVLELADGAGNFGRFRIYRDDALLIDTDSADMMASEVSPFPPSSEVIPFSTAGNFIDTVRMFGWANPAVLNGGTDAFTGAMHFLYDDLEITANSTFKTIVEP